MIVADAARITAAAWILIVVIVSARPMLLGDALTLSFDTFSAMLDGNSSDLSFCSL